MWKCFTNLFTANGNVYPKHYNGLQHWTNFYQKQKYFPHSPMKVTLFRRDINGSSPPQLMTIQLFVAMSLMNWGFQTLASLNKKLIAEVRNVLLLYLFTYCASFAACGSKGFAAMLAIKRSASITIDFFGFSHDSVESQNLNPQNTDYLHLGKAGREFNLNVTSRYPQLKYGLFSKIEW